MLIELSWTQTVEDGVSMGGEEETPILLAQSYNVHGIQLNVLDEDMSSIGSSLGLRSILPAPTPTNLTRSLTSYGSSTAIYFSKATCTITCNVGPTSPQRTSSGKISVPVRSTSASSIRRRHLDKTV